MLWLVVALVSAFFLGIYDIFKKISLKGNAVMPVLFMATLTGALIFLPLLLGSEFKMITVNHPLYVSHYPIHVHILFFLKSVIVGSSWIFAYYALKHLPITIVAPIRSTAPVWVLIGAIIIFQERLNGWQWAGIIITFIFFYWFSLTGKSEGISFRKNRWVFFIILATLIGAASGLYDKWLLLRYDRLAVQAWFSVYLVVVMLPALYFIWFPKRLKQSVQWRWSIPMIGVMLTLADFLYFYALQMDEALISLISIIRRSSVVYSFFIGGYIFREQNVGKKAVILFGMLIGIALILWGSRF